jgi:hypothetical protein
MNYRKVQWLSRSGLEFRAIALIMLLLPTASALAAGPCGQTSAQQDAWVSARINDLVRAAHAAYEKEDEEEGYNRVLDRIAGTMKRCRLLDNVDFINRYSEFVGYVKVLSLSRKRDHELGFEVSDREYFRETRGLVTIPDFLLTTSFLRAVRRFETVPQAKALLRQLNQGRAIDQQLLFFSYESRHLGTPDNDDSYRRLLIVVPGNASQSVPEKWVQFGIPDPKARLPVRNVSVVAVIPGDGKTTDAYFKDYFRTYRRNGSITIKGRWELGYGDDNCVKCHKSGVLPIFPVSASVSLDEEPLVEAVNKRFLNYGAPRFGKYLDISKFGPGLGSTLPEEYRQKRSGANAATCASCHQPNGLGSLNWPMDSVLISSFVEGGRMPLGLQLRDSERTLLYNRLIQDYFAIDDEHPGILKTWLMGKTR